MNDKSYRDRQQRLRQWLRFSLWPIVLMVIFTCLSVTAMTASSTSSAQAQGGGTTPPGTVPPGTLPPNAVIYLGYKSSDEIEFDDGTPDFVYKNEDIVTYTPATGQFALFFDGSVCGLANTNLDDFDILDNGRFIFTLRSKFTIPGLGEVDDSDVIEYTPSTEDGVCGTFAFRLKGADVGLTKGAEDIDGLGVAADGSLLISTIGTTRVPSSTGELVAKDRSLIKLNEAGTIPTWSLYFDGDDVGLTRGSEDIRSVWEDPALDAQGNQNLYLTLSGKFDVESQNEDKGDKNDVEGCTLLQAGETTECAFFKLWDGATVGAENQLDGLAITFGPVSTAVRAVAAGASDDSVEATVEAASDASDWAELLAEGAEGVSIDDFVEFVTQIYLPLVER